MTLASLSISGVSESGRSGWGNFVGDLRLDPEEAMRGRTSLFQKWSMSAAESSARKPDPAASVELDGQPKQGLIALVKYLASRYSKLTLPLVPDAFGSGIRAPLTAIEVAGCSDYVPDAYPMRGGEIVFEYLFDNARVSLIFSNTYCHLLSFMNDEMANVLFEGDTYSPAPIARRLRELLERIETPATR